MGIWLRINGFCFHTIKIQDDRFRGPALSSMPNLRQYLIEVRGKLEARKGTLIRSAIAKGVWWSLLGVGPVFFRALQRLFGRRMARGDFQTGDLK